MQPKLATQSKSVRFKLIRNMTLSLSPPAVVGATALTIRSAKSDVEPNAKLSDRLRPKNLGGEIKNAPGRPTNDRVW
jgi:hypothetical protein